MNENHWKPIYRNDGKLDHYIKGNEKIIVSYKTIGLLTEIKEILWYKRDGIYYTKLSKAMDDDYHKNNNKTLDK